MKNVPALCLGVAIGAAVFGSMSWLRAEDAPRVEARTMVGRYQIVLDRESKWVIDTMTSETWFRDTGSGPGWRSAGAPADIKK